MAQGWGGAPVQPSNKSVRVNHSKGRKRAQFSQPLNLALEGWEALQACSMGSAAPGTTHLFTCV